MKEATLKTKVDNVNQVVKEIKDSKSVVVLNCIGLTVADTMELRTELHENGCYMRVIRNNVMKRAADECGYSELDEYFVGPNALAFSKDVNSAAKIIYNFAEKHELLDMKAGIVDGTVMKLEELKIIASLPDKNGMLSMLLSVLQAPVRNLACAVQAVADKKEQE